LSTQSLKKKRLGKFCVLFDYNTILLQIEDNLKFEMHPTFKKGFSGKTVFKQINFTVRTIYYTFSEATCFLRKMMFSQLSKGDK
jgi:hypothetical protein